jgi:hypothetical protein
MNRITSASKQRRQRKVKSMTSNISSALHQNWFYEDCFTINPRRTAKAWEKLNANQWALEIGMWPTTLHLVLLETLRERKSFDRVEQRRP